MSLAELNHLSLIGISHLNAPLEIREKVSITSSDAPGFLDMLRARDVASEGLVLSTCNRTELYCLTDHPTAVRSLAVEHANASIDGLEEMFYLKNGREMVRHAFSVASGLDSMILGEPEIFGQMKRAFSAARAGGFAGSSLTRLFERTFNVAKQVRANTDIARESVSAPVLCARLSQSIFGDLGQCQLLCIGSGTMIENALQHFTTHKIGSFTVANRTLRNAQGLSERFNASYMPYEEIAANLHKHDIIISATSSVLPVIGKGALERALEQRKRRPLAIFDLAVPRDVEPEAARLEDAFIFTIDDIGKLANSNMEKRKAAAKVARSYINQATEELVAQFERDDLKDSIKNLRSRLDQHRDEETEQALRKIEAGKDPKVVIAELAHRLTNRLAHDPLRALSSTSASYDVIEEISSWYENNERD